MIQLDSHVWLLFVVVAYLSGGSQIELLPGGRDRPVAFADRHRYACQVLRARFQESDRQMRAVRQGLNLVIPNAEQLLLLLTSDELELRVCGSTVVDCAVLRAHTQYRD